MSKGGVHPISVIKQSLFQPNGCTQCGTDSRFDPGRPGICQTESVIQIY
jgi:hypothetical protein